MKVSLGWLKEYVPLRWSAARLAEALTMAGLEVDGQADRFDYLKSICVARIDAVHPHPKADKLKICEVSTGKASVAVVCGAPNAAPGLRVPWARPSTVFPDGRVLAAAVIRGVASHGMLCSAAELELGQDHSGVWVLPENLPLGIPLGEALGLEDIVLDVDLTPNRPDCLSIIGIAREVAALQGEGLTPPDTTCVDADNRIADMTSVAILDPDLCPRYAARIIENVTIGPSPDWLQDRIRSVGMRPINNVVDVTNFVMMELGQPLHAFDFDHLAGQRIVVRRAREGEKFVTLDKKERGLTADMLLICDGEKPVAIGGVMGGLNSEVAPLTRRILLESACFNAVSIRKTAKMLGLITEASHRFERGVDPGGTLAALNRAAKLIAVLGGGDLVGGYIDANPAQSTKRTLHLSVKATNRLLGTSLTAGEIIQLIGAIDFQVMPAGDDADQLIVDVPSFRVDVARPEDLMEEVARIWGYNRIPTRTPRIAAGGARRNRRRELTEKIRQFMLGNGFTETLNYAFIGAHDAERLMLNPDDRRRRAVKILNPLSEDQGVMRTSLIPGLLATMGRNVAQQVRHLKLFELGKIFIDRGADQLPEEEEMLAGLWTGARVEAAWYAKTESVDYYDIKGVAEGLLQTLRLAAFDFRRVEPAAAPFLRQGVAASVWAGQQCLGCIGELHPEVATHFQLKQTAFVFELAVDLIRPFISEHMQAQPIPVFPAVARDITLIVDHKLPAQAVLDQLERQDETLIEDIQLLDVFTGPPIPAGKKSLSLRVTYRSPSATLEDEAVNAIHQALTQALLERFKADLPA